MTDTDRIIGKIEDVHSRMTERIEGVHARVGRVEDSVSQLAKTTGEFQVITAKELGGLTAKLEAVSETADEAKREGRTAGGIMGTIIAGVVTAVGTVVAWITWGK